MGIETHAVDAGKMAAELGNLKLVNTIMLGAVADYLPFAEGLLKNKILARFQQRKPHLVEINAKAFDLGRQASDQDPGSVGITFIPAARKM